MTTQTAASPPPSSSLDHLESNSHALESLRVQVQKEADAFEVEFRHSGQFRQRQRIREALEYLEKAEGRIERWDDCGRFATVERSIDRPGQYRVACSRCRDRFCPTCGQERSRVIAANVVQRVEKKPHRFITLTVRHGTEDLKVLLTKLLDGFKKLRRSSVWRSAVAGGCAFLEVKKVNGWHPHLHLIVQGNWMDHKEVSKTWLQCTGDSSIVDIKLIREVEKTAAYVTKYASKPLDRSVTFNQKDLIEAMVVLKGVKLLTTFGSWRGEALCESASDEVWETVCGLSTLMERAHAGEQEALSILTMLRSAMLWRKAEEERRNDTTDGSVRSP